jgi:hypothetical protein
MLASGSADGTVILWDVATRVPLHPPLVPPSGERFSGTKVGTLAFSPDSTMLISEYCVKFDNNGNCLQSDILVWDVKTGQQLGLPMPAYDGAITQVAFASNREIAVSGSRDGTLLVWNIGLATWIDRVCEIANRNLTKSEWELYFTGQAYNTTCPDLPAHPSHAEAAAKQKAVEAFERSKSGRSKGDSRSAGAGYEQATAKAVETNDDALNNDICWEGTLDGFAKIVLSACEHAVKLVPSDGRIRDSRGLARALTGDYRGAVDDFRYFVQWSAQTDERDKREAWIRELESGGNPFNAATLSRLR